MALSRLFFIAAFCLATTLTYAAGIDLIEVPADKDGPALRGAVWTPCDVPADQIALGPIVIWAVKNCSLPRPQLPLIVMSHGFGGNFLNHHDTAAELADAGFVVVSVNHPGDSFQNMSRSGHLSALAMRPVDTKRLLSYMLVEWGGHSTVNADQVGFFGFSRGGYTGLVAAGAVPDFRLLQGRFCPPTSQGPFFCGEIHRNDLPAPPSPDPRIKAAVIVDPLNIFGAGSLKAVTIPIQLWASALGGDGVAPQDVEKVRRELPLTPDWHVAMNATHIAFLAPCSPALAKAAPDICSDEPGFDRVAFHADFNAKVRAFFRAHLK